MERIPVFFQPLFPPASQMLVVSSFMAIVVAGLTFAGKIRGSSMGALARLNVDQILVAIGQLTDAEAVDLKRRLPRVLAAATDGDEGSGWLYLAESAFGFWADPAEDIYDDLAPANGAGSTGRPV